MKHKFSFFVFTLCWIHSERVLTWVCNMVKCRLLKIFFFLEICTDVGLLCSFFLPLAEHMCSPFLMIRSSKRVRSHLCIPATVTKSLLWSPHRRQEIGGLALFSSQAGLQLVYYYYFQLDSWVLMIWKLFLKCFFKKKKV